MDAAFMDRDGKVALVVHNENDDPRSFAVAHGGRSFEYTLPGGALATFTWPAIRDRYELLAAEGMSATGPETVDDDATTRWTTGAAQQPGQRLEVDLGRRQTVRRIVLDTGIDIGDYPRGYAVYAGRDGDEPIATGAGSGQLTTIDIPATEARFLRVVQTATAPQSWSVADLRVYR
jgi:glucosylceramidase